MININATIRSSDFGGAVEEKKWCITKRKGDIIAVQTPEGPSDDFVWEIVAFNFFTQSQYVLKTRIVGKIVHDEDDSYYMNGRACADKLIERIKKAGKIDLNNWEYDETPL
ncbi:hypothetical protein KNT91_gp132 [Aeromonas phage 60AhydR15PP]|uniref:Uncharacterized protein n=1 Tax=Aeromonas phage 60AhydR15PP TaxID=2163979 RepID=A0A2S1PGG4_9CAUD|nr:hypothetical protein KNT91_gp132 [Aeromonas phage 60AhydR15PP]AWH15656.1 hypothetical protein [Aeromonas phage 60AhydR15PP]